MKSLRRYQFGLWVVILFFAATFSGKAAGFGLGLSNSPTIGSVNSNLTFTLVITNLTGNIVPNLLVSNSFPTSFLLATNSGFTNTTGGGSVFSTNNIPVGTPVFLTFQMRPTAAGTFTNFIVVAAPGLGFASVLTNVVQIGSGNTDLGVFITTPSTNVFPGDVAQYNVVVTNAGPGAASSFFVTNSFPAGVGVVQVTPGTGVTTNTAGRIVFSVASLSAANALTNTVFIIPTNTGPLTLTASIAAVGLVDTNTSNNSVTNILTVTTPDTNQLAAAFSTQDLDFQTGLFRQTVTLVNTSATAVASARLIVVGLTASNKLYNAVGTNFGHPFVVYPNAINAGDTVNFLLEFYYPSRVPQTNLTYVAYGVPMPNLVTMTNGTPLALRVLNASNNRVLLEFPSTPGKTYRIVYSSDAAFTNPLMAEPPIVAPADKTQWIDEGPPKTISFPGDSASRFYKVFQQ